MRVNNARSLAPYLLVALALFSLGACQVQQEKITLVGPTPAGPILTADLPAAAPSPSAIPPEALPFAATATVDIERRPGPGITASAVTADGSFWYGFDLFDGIGGTAPGSPNHGLYRLLDGQVSHFDVPGTIRILVVAPDDTLYIGAGCGVLQFQAGRLHALLNVECNQSGRRPALFPMDIAFDQQGLLWVGGAHNLASYDGQSWQEYGLPAQRVAAAPDGTIWTMGWDGRAGSDCCLSHLAAGGLTSYTWSAEAQVPPEVQNKLFGPPSR